MSNYTRQILTAATAISNAGRDVVLKSYVKTGPVYDPTKTATSTTVKALQVNAKRSEYDRGLVTASSRVYLFAASSGITKTMKIVDGEELSITNIETLQPGDGVVMYRVIADA